MLIRIGNTDITDLVGYKVTHRDVTKEVKNTLGHRFIYALGTEYIIELKMGALTQDKMNVLLGALSSITFNVTFIDIDGTEQTKEFSRSDRAISLLTKLNAECWWGEQTITLTSTGA